MPDLNRRCYRVKKAITIEDFHLRFGMSAKGEVFEKKIGHGTTLISKVSAGPDVQPGSFRCTRENTLISKASTNGMWTYMQCMGAGMARQGAIDRKNTVTSEPRTHAGK